MAFKAIALASALGITLGASSFALAQQESGTTAAVPRVDKLEMPTGPLTQAFLITGLYNHGYSDVKLSSDLPDPYNPRPELTSGSVSSPDDPKAQVTPLHIGWNGTAVKEGRTVNVYVVGSAPSSVPENVPGQRKGDLVFVYLDHVQAGAR
jgi:hypothetical protein